MELLRLRPRNISLAQLESVSGEQFGGMFYYEITELGQAVAQRYLEGLDFMKAPKNEVARVLERFTEDAERNGRSG
jgi:hypothetical protein